MSEGISESRLVEIEERARKTVPGPWIVGQNPAEVIAPCPCCGLVATCATYGPPDATEPECFATTFIAAARQDIPDLLAEVRRLQKLFGELWGSGETDSGPENYEGIVEDILGRLSEVRRLRAAQPQQEAFWQKVKDAYDRANNRWEEWGERALMVGTMLDEALTEEARRNLASGAASEEWVARNEKLRKLVDAWREPRQYRLRNQRDIAIKVTLQQCADELEKEIAPPGSSPAQLEKEEK